MPPDRRGDVSLGVQEAIYLLLKADPELITYQGNRVYDNIPQGALSPYTQIGDDTWEDGGDKTDDGRVGVIQIHVYADQRNYETLKKIMARINELLHDRDEPLNIQTGQIVWLRFARSFCVIEPDYTKHGIITFRVETNSPRN
jgi:hypothetical protein